MKKVHPLLFAGALGLLGLLASSCGDSSSKASGTASTSTPSTVTNSAATGCDSSKPPILVGGVGQLQNFAGFEDGINARVGRENTSCIQGRKIKLVAALDDAGDPQKNLDAVKNLVENQKATVVIEASTVLLAGSSDYLAAKKVPFFGWGFLPGFCGKDAWGYGFNGCLSGYALDVSKAVSVPGAKLNGSLSAPMAEVVKKPADQYTVAIYVTDNDAGKFADIQYSALWSKSQILDKQFTPGQGVVDYTQYYNKVKQLNPDVVVVSLEFAEAVKFKAGLAAFGYKGVAVDYTAYVPGLLDSSKDTAAALEGSYSNTQFPPQEEGRAATTAFAKDLVAIGKPAFVTQGGSIGYWSADLMIQMLKAIKGDITGDSFRAMAEGGFTYSPPDGGPGPISYPAGHYNPAPCSALVKVTGGKYVSAVPFKCYTLVDPKK
jgi:branched-chain amino acid transport system substrate-binding protein